MARNRVIWVLAIVLVVALVIYAVMFMNRGKTQSSSQFPQRADGIVFVDEAVTYDELGRMTASTDLVVQGTVETVAQGMTHRYPPSEAMADEVDRLITVGVDDVVYSDGTKPSGTISVIEGWWSQGVGYALEGMPWAKPGDKGYFYLVADPVYPAGTYTYVGSTGRVLLTGDEVSVNHHCHGPWDDTVAGRDLEGPRMRDANGEVRPDAVEKAILAAAESARRGESKPVPRPRITEPND